MAITTPRRRCSATMGVFITAFSIIYMYVVTRVIAVVCGCAQAFAAVLVVAAAVVGLVIVVVGRFYPHIEERLGRASLLVDSVVSGALSLAVYRGLLAYAASTGQATPLNVSIVWAFTAIIPILYMLGVHYVYPRLVNYLAEDTVSRAG